ncbi:MAG TPA: helix-turn-helix domain-containing protein [Luteimonas sp.]|nr:helix-turn-helix domain-containing protein [Luteimonas sp.]
MAASLPLADLPHFGHDGIMDVAHSDAGVSAVAAAIAEPARTRMLYCLMDGHARTSTELAIVAEVSAPTASTHLARLKQQGLVKVHAQGKHRYYSLDGERVAAALEALKVVAGVPAQAFVPRTPPRLRAARTCYDHMAGGLAVALHGRFLEYGWLAPSGGGDDADAYEVTRPGADAFLALGIDLDAARAHRRRRFAYACLDWSERRPHLAGTLGAAFLDVALKRKWVTRDLDSRALGLTRSGRRELRSRFDLEFGD